MSQEKLEESQKLGITVKGILRILSRCEEGIEFYEIEKYILSRHSIVHADYFLEMMIAAELIRDEFVEGSDTRLLFKNN